MRYLDALAKRKYSVRMVNGQLRIKPPLDPEIKPKVTRHRDEILLELARAGNGPRVPCRFCGEPVALVPYPDGDGWHWTECQNCGEAAIYRVTLPYHLIASRLLCDTIAIGRDWPREYVGYTWAEVESLRGAAPELLKAVHEVKRKFPGASVENKDGIWYEQAQRNMEAI